MNKKSMILMAIMTIASIPAIQAHGKDMPWDRILVDVSSDIITCDKSGKSEVTLLNAIIDEIEHHINLADSVSAFAYGRIVLPFQYLQCDSKNNYDNIRSCIGDGTSIYNAILSAANTSNNPQRLLIVTNGVNNGISFHPHTVSKILRNKGVVVDALCFYSDADSIVWDSVYIAKPKIDKQFSEVVESTGGRFVRVKGVSDAHSAFQSLLNKAKSGKAEKIVENNEYDDVLLSKTLNRITATKLDIIEVDTCTHVKYHGVEFKGLTDIRKHSIYPYTNVYIGIDKSKYPCFDEYDRQNENRYYENIYFADSAQRLANKKQVIEQTEPLINYRKLHDKTPYEVLPMIYYKGEGDKMLVCGLEIEYDDEETEPEE